MKNINDQQFEQDLNIISNLKEVSAPDFIQDLRQQWKRKQSWSNLKDP